MLRRLRITEYDFFPQNNCIYSYYALFQDSANRVSANRDWTSFSVHVKPRCHIIHVWYITLCLKNAPTLKRYTSKWQGSILMTFGTT